MFKKAIIIDIDGTLSDPSERLHYVNRKGKKDWGSFLGEMGNDKINSWCAEIIRRFEPDHAIFFITGRNETYRQVTTDWLNTNLKVSVLKADQYYGLSTKLIMRPEKDFRDDHVIKKEIVENLQKQGYEFLFAIDDRARVVDMWRSMGITALECADWERKQQVTHLKNVIDELLDYTSTLSGVDVEHLQSFYEGISHNKNNTDEELRVFIGKNDKT